MVLISVNGIINHKSISVLDRGVLFGESVYEVIPYHHNALFQFNEHINRLEKSFEQLCQIPFPRKQVILWITHYLQHITPKSCHSIYVQLTSGNSEIRNHIRKLEIPNCIIHQTYAEPVIPQRYAKGFRAIAVEDQRSGMTNLKTVQLAFNTQSLNLAYQNGYDDAVFIHNGYIVEAASSNFFAVINHVLVTPPLQGIVPGITRDALLRLVKKHNIPYEIRPISVDEVQFANEVFLTSSVKLLRPLREIEGIFSANGPFLHWNRLFSLFQNYITESCHHEETTR